MKTSRFTDSQILGILTQAENGVRVAELCREHGISWYAKTACSSGCTPKKR